MGMTTALAKPRLPFYRFFSFDRFSSSIVLFMSRAGLNRLGGRKSDLRRRAISDALDG